MMASLKRKEAIGTINAQHVCAFRPEPEGGYSVRCAAFPELITHGRTLQEARAMAREALELCLEVYQEEGRLLPDSDADPRKRVREKKQNI
jgi:antitoxin HicB